MAGPTVTVDAVLDDPAFPPLKQRVIARTGLAYYADKDRSLAAAVADRLNAVGSPDCRQYLALLDEGADGQDEAQALAAAITVGETFFFRYPEQFDALRTRILPDCLQRNRGRRILRIWSAACSIGAEPYSLAILLARDFGSALAGWEVSIIGTDINQAFLAQAQRATYGDWALRGMPESMRTACFEPQDGLFRLRPDYRRGVRFTVHNLATGPLPDYRQGLIAFDLILCRNVLIYFDAETRERVLAGLCGSLVDDGWLVVGHAEVGPEVAARFTPVAVPGATVYRRPGMRTAGPPPPAKPAAPPPSRPAPPPADVRPVGKPSPPPPLPAPPARRKAAEGDPASVLSLADGGDPEGALALCETAIEQHPLEAELHLLRGLLEQQLARGDDLASLRRAVYLDGDFVLAHYHLALAYWRRGRQPQAARHFRVARRLLGPADADTPVRAGRGLTAGELRALVDTWLSGG